MTPFFEADLRGEVFQCLIGPSGPMVIGDGGGVCLGVCAMRNLADLQWRRHGQIEIADEVGQPTFDEARELGQLLGIVMWRPMLHPRVRAEAFYVSRAFDALRTWVAEHSKVAAELAKHEASRHYLPDWYERVLARASLPPSPTDGRIRV